MAINKGIVGIGDASTPVVPSDNFNTVLYTGSGTSKSVTGVGFPPDLVWGKATNSSSLSHILFDVVRGENKQISADLTDAQVVRSSAAYEFDDDGFTVTTAGNLNNPNDFVAWCWKAGGAAVSNTNGSITSQVSANVDAGFSISTFTSDASTLTAGHGLNSTPDLIIVKATSFVDSWFVNSIGLTNRTDRALRLNETSGEETNSAFWNNTAPTSTTFSLGSGVSVSGESYVAYSWHSVAGYSKIGSYEGDGSSSGQTITGLGFNPRFLLVKAIDSSAAWRITDSARGDNIYLYANLANGNDSSSGYMSLITDGFKLNGLDSNQGSQTFIYMAFA